MEIAQYILQKLLSQAVLVCSWGFNSPTTIENGLSFSVNGFKFKGVVKVVYNDVSNTFTVKLIKEGEIVKTIERICFDELINVIDNEVEKVSNYESIVEETYRRLNNQKNG